MSHTPNELTHRRGFLGRLIAGGAAIAGSGVILPRLAAQQPAESSSAGSTLAPEPRPGFSDSWVRRLTAKHRQVFDAPEIAHGTVLHQARTFMKGYQEVYGATDADMNAVLVIRHSAVPMVLGDALWDRYDFGREGKLKDPTTGRRTKRNPFINVKRDDRYALVWPDGGLDTLISRGAIVLACNLALTGVASMIAQQEKLSRDDAKARLTESLVPGVIVLPSGIFAVSRAQEAGCNYIRAT